ncbi:transporter substrate-binding domain-containing protein [Roseateles saccharophilus]|nr:transporter substrate-binding domain-containing protein [Roseateles saccharophilus]
MRRRSLLAAPLALAAARAGAVESPRASARAGAVLKCNVGGDGPPDFCVDYIRALQRVDPALQLTGLEEALPMARVEADLAAERLDLFFALLKTRERAARFGFVEAPALYNVRHQVAVRADDRIDVRGFDDIRALGAQGVVLATRASGCLSFLAEQPGLIVDAGAADNLQNLRKLLGGRGRFFYQADATLRHLVEAEGLQDRVRILPAVFHADAELLAHAPGLAPERLARITAAMRALELNGTAARLRSAYGLL